MPIGEINGKYNKTNTIELIKVLWRKKLIIIAMSLLCTAATLGITYACVTPQYSAAIMFYVNNSNISLGNNEISISQSDLNAAQSLVDTYIVILNTPETKQAILEELDDSYAEALNNISASAVNSTEIFRVTIIASEREKLYKVAETIGDILPKRISDIVDGSDVRIVNHAYLYSGRVSPSYVKNSIMGMMAGFILSCLFFVIRDLMNNTVRNETYLNDLYNVPILSVVPNLMDNSAKGRYKKYYKHDEEHSSKESKNENEIG